MSDFSDRERQIALAIMHKYGIKTRQKPRSESEVSRASNVYNLDNKSLKIVFEDYVLRENEVFVTPEQIFNIGIVKMGLMNKDDADRLHRQYEGDDSEFTM